MRESAEGPLAERPGPAIRVTTAGRLLRDIRKSGALEMNELARQLQLPAAHLDECIEGRRVLQPVVQMKLAAIVVAAAPQHERAARRLYGQAQTALRLEFGSVESHMVYPKARWR